MWWIFGKTRKHRCPDGTERIVFKNPDDAFPLSVKDWSTRLEGTLNAVKELQGSLGADFKNQIEGFFVQLDQANSSMQSQFRAIYVVYQTDPCGQDGYLATEIQKIIERECTLRRMQIEISKIESLRSQGFDEQELAQVLAETHTRLSKSDIEEKTSIAFQNVEKNTLAWKGGA